MKDYYKILEVSKTATLKEIKLNYYKLSKKYHPDKENGDDEKFKLINEAYSVLSCPKKKKLYDKTGNTEVKNPQKDAAQMLLAIMDVVVNNENTSSSSFYHQVYEEIETSQNNLQSDLTIVQLSIERLEQLKSKRCSNKVKFRSNLINLIDNSIKDKKNRIKYLKYMNYVHKLCLKSFKKYYYEPSLDRLTDFEYTLKATGVDINSIRAFEIFKPHC